MSRKHRRSRDLIEDDLDLLPFMGLFVVLIPMLLLSAVFLEISVIDLALSGDGDETTAESFLLTVAILDEAFVVKAEGSAARIIPRTETDPIQALSSELTRAAAARPDHRSVTIMSEPETRYEDIIAVMDASRDAGLPDISLSGGAS